MLTVLGAGTVWAASGDRPADAKAGIAAQLERANKDQIANAPKQSKPERAAPAAAEGMLTECPDAGWDSGVSETREAPIGAGFMTVTSVWAQTIGRTHVAVYAGAAATDAARGVVLVLAFDFCGKQVGLDSYSPTTRSGALRIQAAAGHRLTLAAEDGSVLAFDVDARVLA